MRKKTEARRLQFVMAAGKLFVTHGIASVTMESIAAEASSSKVTLYNYFSSREALFEAYIIEVGKGWVERLLDAPKTGQTLSNILNHLGMSYLALVTKPDIVALNRLIIGEAGRFPELANLFYELGPEKTLRYIGEVIGELMGKNLLRQGDVRAVSLHFKALCEADIVERIMWGLDCVPADETLLESSVNTATRAFMQLYAQS
ncbi:TetR/AcrR family transcriptional regulator [Martelella alba]|uniref:TetR/AcrR family transcriptional regulator n=1 Tax=Martelella alba TaxID=2590451 RepID=A0ABY2SF63_9HYPH|nr:TetR/AcrR family transcriptional regulator [Martelella alba]TKI03515.1 TetR/AcrR family transcriptional regulator [Martelella alba]